MTTNEMMSLTTLATRAGLTKPTARALVRRLGLGAVIPGRKRKWFTEADLALISQPRKRGRRPGATGNAPPAPDGFVSFADACTVSGYRPRRVRQLIKEYEAETVLLTAPGGKQPYLFVKRAAAEILPFHLGNSHPRYIHDLKVFGGHCKCLEGLRAVRDLLPRLFLPETTHRQDVQDARAVFVAQELRKRSDEPYDPVAVVESILGPL